MKWKSEERKVLYKRLSVWITYTIIIYINVLNYLS